MTWLSVQKPEKTASTTPGRLQKAFRETCRRWRSNPNFIVGCACPGPQGDPSENLVGRQNASVFLLWPCLLMRHNQFPAKELKTNMLRVVGRNRKAESAGRKGNKNQADSPVSNSSSNGCEYQRGRHATNPPTNRSIPESQNKGQTSEKQQHCCLSQFRPCHFFNEFDLGFSQTTSI